MRTNLATTNARIDALEGKLDRILAHLEPSAPAKTTRKAAAPKAKADRRPKAAPKHVKALCKSTRLAFVAAAMKQYGVDFSGWSTKAIAAACIEEPSLVPSGFRIGEGYQNLLG